MTDSVARQELGAKLPRDLGEQVKTLAFRAGFDVVTAAPESVAVGHVQDDVAGHTGGRHDAR